MVRIRLRRVGRTKQPSYRIVVADARSPRDGRYIEVIGFYNPRTQPATMTIAGLLFASYATQANTNHVLFTSISSV